MAKQNSFDLAHINSCRTELSNRFLEFLPRLLVLACDPSLEVDTLRVSYPLTKCHKVPLGYPRLLGHEVREYINIPVLGKSVKISSLVAQSQVFQSFQKRLDTLELLTDKSTAAQLSHNDLKLLVHDDLEVALDITMTLWFQLFGYFAGKLEKLQNWRSVCCDSLLQTLIYWFFVVREERWVEELKFHTNWLFSAFFKQETPPPIQTPSKPGTLFIGALNLHFRKWFSSKRTRGFFNSFRFSVLSGLKKGFPTLPAEYVEDSLASHAERLSKVELTEERLLWEIERTSREVFKGKIFYRPPSRVSTSACLEHPRSERGPFAYYMAEWAGVKSYQKGGPLACLSAYASHVLAIPAMFHMSPSGEKFYENFPMEELVAPCLEDLRSFDIKTEGGVDASVILEPLKARVITVASVKRNAALQGIQSQMMNCMRRFRVFDLTNNPFSNEVLQRCFQPGATYVSADYSAATDFLHLDATLRAAQSLTSDPEVYKWLKESLSASEVRYNVSEYRCPDRIEQRNGQLMGCMVSFPLLCVINAAIARRSFEIAHWKVSGVWRDYRLDDVPMLVNGDDLLFSIVGKQSERTEHVRIWEELIAGVGFRKSVGKNFVSTEFCTVNSCMVLPREGRLVRVPSLKMSPVMGRQGRAQSEHCSYQERLRKLKGAFSHSITSEPVSDGPLKEMVRRVQKLCLQRNDVGHSHYPPSWLGMYLLEDSFKNIKYLHMREGNSIFGSFKETSREEERERRSKKWTQIAVPETPLNSKKGWSSLKSVTDMHHEDIYNWCLSKLMEGLSRRQAPGK